MDEKSTERDKAGNTNFTCACSVLASGVNLTRQAPHARWRRLPSVHRPFPREVHVPRPWQVHELRDDFLDGALSAVLFWVRGRRGRRGEASVCLRTLFGAACNQRGKEDHPTREGQPKMNMETLHRGRCGRRRRATAGERERSHRRKGEGGAERVSHGGTWTTHKAREVSSQRRKGTIHKGSAEEGRLGKLGEEVEG